MLKIHLPKSFLFSEIFESLKEAKHFNLTETESKYKADIQKALTFITTEMLKIAIRSIEEGHAPNFNIEMPLHVFCCTTETYFTTDEHRKAVVTATCSILEAMCFKVEQKKNSLLISTFNNKQDHARLS